MSLCIFLFDLAALINSLMNFLEVTEAENPPLNLGATLEKVEEAQQNQTSAD